jgi:anti-sigma28 factor (negative regulator of flagellin synthesis)
MAHSSKQISRSSKASIEAPMFTDPSGLADVKLSPRVAALRKLVVSGQYQISPRRLAHQIMRAAGVKPE